VLAAGECQPANTLRDAVTAAKEVERQNFTRLPDVNSLPCMPVHFLQNSDMPLTNEASCSYTLLFRSQGGGELYYLFRIADFKPSVTGKA